MIMMAFQGLPTSTNAITVEMQLIRHFELTTDQTVAIGEKREVMLDYNYSCPADLVRRGPV